MNRRYTYDDAFNQNMLADTDVCQNGGISARGHGMDSFSSNTASKAKSATKPKPSNEYEHERLVPLSTSTNGDTDDSSFRRFRRLRIVAGALCALSVALLVALIAVSIVLSNRSTSGMPTPAAPNFTITPEAFGQYTRVLIRNEGVCAFCFAPDVHEVSCLSDMCIFLQRPASMSRCCPRWAEPFTSLHCGQLAMPLN